MKPDTVLQLAVVGGDVFQFSRYEVPEKIAFGGSQRLAVHELVGGRRVVDAMGASDMPLEWRGLMLGDTSLQRARYLDYLRKSGKQCVLTWSEMYYSVVVAEFVAEFERFYNIPYSIKLEVVQDLSQPVKVIANPGIDELIAGDMATANNLGGLIGDSKLSGLLATLDAAIKGVSSFAKATQTVINGVLGPVQAVQSRVNLLIASTGNTAANISTFGGALPGNAVSQKAAQITSQVAAANTLPYLYNLNSVTGRMAKNLKTI